MRRRRVHVRLREHHEQAGIPRVRDPHLRAVQDVVVALAIGRRPDRLQIAAGVRLGQRESASPLRRGQRRQVPELLIGRAVVPDDVADDEVRSEHARDAHPPAREFLEDRRVQRRREIRSAVLRGNVDAEQPQRLHALDERVRVLVPVFERRRGGDDLAVDEFGDGLDHEVAFVGGSHGRHRTTAADGLTILASAGARVASVWAQAATARAIAAPVGANRGRFNARAGRRPRLSRRCRAAACAASGSARPARSRRRPIAAAC